MELQEVLQKTWLVAEEAKIYLTCLEFWPLPVTTIWRLCGYPRTSVYTYVDKLAQLWFVKQQKIRGVLHITALAADQLPNLLSQRVQDIEVIKDNIQLLMPQFQTLVKANVHAPRIRQYSGEHGFTIISEIIESGMYEYCMISAAIAFSDDAKRYAEFFLDKTVSSEKRLLGIYTKQLERLIKSKNILSEQLMFIRPWTMMYADIILANHAFFSISYGYETIITEIRDPHLFSLLVALLRIVSVPSL